MAQAFTRVTLIGSSRHLDLLLPSDQPVGGLVPQILNLLEDQPQDDVAAKVVVTPDGGQLDARASLEAAGILDGTALRLCNASEAPPAAVVYDVTDIVVEESEDVPGRWNRRFRDITAAAFAAAGIWGGAEILLSRFAPDHAWWILLAAAAVLLASGAALGRPPRTTAIGPALLAAGWLAGIGGVLHLPAPAGYRALYAAVLTVVALAAVGLVSRRPRSLFSAAGTLALLTAVWLAAGLLTGDAVRTAAVAALISVLVLGLMPQTALSASGLATLDDQRAKGGTIRRTDALHAISAAHRSLTLGTVLTAASVALGLWLIGGDTATQVWSVPLLLVLILAAALRARSFPLAVQRMALYAAAAVGLVSLALAAMRFAPELTWLTGVLVLAVAVCFAVSLTVELPDHTAARFRLLANRLEGLAILASVPLVLGMFGIFAQLLESF